MPDQLQLRGGTTAQHAAFTGASKEVTVDTTKKTVVVHDGSTVGGSPVMREDASNSALILGSAASPSLKFTGDTNTGLYSPGADQVAVATGGTGRLFVDSSGRLLAGTSTARAGGSTTAQFQLEGTTLAGSSSSFIYNGNDTSGPRITFGKSRGTTIGSNTVLQSGDNLGAIWFTGSNGTDLSNAGASIVAAVDGEPLTAGDTTDLPGRIIISTTPDGSSTPVERVRIDSSGRVAIGTAAPIGLLTLAESATDGEITLRSSGGAGSNNRARIIYGYQSGGSAYGGYLAFNTTSSSNINAEAVRIDSSGRVGIGTTSAFERLTIADGTNIIAGAGELAFNNYTNEGIGFTFGRTNDGSRTMALGVVDANKLALAGREGLVFAVGGAGTYAATTEAARIDSSGRLLVGTSSGIAAPPGPVTTQVNSALQVQGTIYATSMQSIGHWGTTASACGTLSLQRSRGASVGTRAAVLDTNALGEIVFSGDDGTNFVKGASIKAEVDGTPGADDMPGRLVLSTTLDGASSPTEAFRITNDRVRCYNQAAPVAVNTTATLTVSDLKTGIITSSTAAAVTMTLPTGTDTEAGFSGVYTNMTFEWAVINTGATNAVTIAAGTGHTIVGSATVAASNSGRFATRRTAANTFVTYRLSS